MLHRLEQEENKAEAEYDQLMARLSDPADRQIAEEAMLEERDHAVVLRTLAGGAMPTPRSTLDTILRRERWHVRGTGWIGDAIYGVNDGLGAVFGIVSGMAGYTGGSEVVLAAGLAGTLASALSMGAGAYLASKSQREVYESEVARERAEIEEDPHEELLELELFYQLKGFSAEEARSMAERMQKEPKQFLRTLVHEELGLSEETFPNPWRSTLSASVSTAIGGFIPIIPFFFTVGMPAVIASFVISTLAHFVVGASKALVTTRSVVGERRRDDDGRHHRSGDHLRPRRRVRRPLTRLLTGCLRQRTPAPEPRANSANNGRFLPRAAGISFALPSQACASRRCEMFEEARAFSGTVMHAVGERCCAASGRPERPQGFAGLQGRREERRTLRAVHDLRRRERAT